MVQKQLTTAAFPTSASPIARESTSTHDSVEKRNFVYRFIKFTIQLLVNIHELYRIIKRY